MASRSRATLNNSAGICSLGQQGIARKGDWGLGMSSFVHCIFIRCPLVSLRPCYSYLLPSFVPTSSVAQYAAYSLPDRHHTILVLHVCHATLSIFIVFLIMCMYVACTYECSHMLAQVPGRVRGHRTQNSPIQLSLAAQLALGVLYPASEC